VSFETQFVETALRVERGVAAALAQPSLAIVDWGVPAAHAIGGLRIAVRAPLLRAPAAGAVEAWLGGATIAHGRTSIVDHANDGDWLFGRVLIDEAEAGGIEAAARQAYDAIFATLEASRFGYLQRVWNYIGDINREVDGLERYRSFNIGRQDAFIAADYPAFEGAPAACGLGVPAGPLAIHFLASATPPVPIENPRQVSAYRYPSSYGPRAPSFSRGAITERDGQRLLFISGTASIVGHESVHVGDVVAQTREAITNLQAVVEAANQSEIGAGAGFALSQAFCTVYVRHVDDLEAIRSAFESMVGASSVAARQAVYLKADVCRHELVVEIEATVPAASGAA
jgi:enamine deaminase RidA (YjgF/YER057c/UK114 family)